MCSGVKSRCSWNDRRLARAQRTSQSPTAYDRTRNSGDKHSGAGPNRSSARPGRVFQPVCPSFPGCDVA